MHDLFEGIILGVLGLILFAILVLFFAAAFSWSSQRDIDRQLCTNSNGTWIETARGNPCILK